MTKIFDALKSFFEIMGLLLLIMAAVVFCCIPMSVKTLPAGLIWNEKEITLSGGELLELKNKHVSVKQNDGEILFETEKDYYVQDVTTADLDSDGRQDIIFLLWKKGRYGRSKPFWVSEEETDLSQHIFIYNIGKDGKMRQKWCASDIGYELGRMKIMEDNPKFLLTEDLEGGCKIWSWQGFGLAEVKSEVEFIAFGDNIIHDAIMEYADAHENGSYDFLYNDVKKEIQQADIAALQQESLLVGDKAMYGGYPSFGTPVAVGEAIADAGFDVVSCAGNHALDRGTKGIDTTLDFYNGAGITCVGIQKSSDTSYKPYEIVNKNGISIALFNYTYGTNNGDPRDKYPNMIHFLPEGQDEEDAFVEELKSCRDEADISIVFVHWGNEYETEPNEYQRHMAELMAQGGVDAVIGTHPHVVQSLETVQRPDGGVMNVFYSLGNFRADQGQRAETRTGAEAVLTISHSFDGAKITGCEIKEVEAYWKGLVEDD
ncbi:MAG: CapA family protein [Butyrivibrio sp.]|nr:CapA family protein [Butyrivibrio sp.]